MPFHHSYSPRPWQHEKPGRLRTPLRGPSLKKSRRLVRRILSVGVIGLVALFLIGTILAAWARKDLPDPHRLSDRMVSESTKLYDREGKTVIYEIYSERKRTLVPLSEIPPEVKWATIAIEDKRFYEHRGIAFKSLGRAVAFNLLGDRVAGFLLGRRSGAGGASTLTQQLVKNAILTNERSLARKLKEALLAVELERKYTKDEILQLYLNETPYGSTNYGVEAASLSYFGKSVREATLAEAAALAALPQAPTRYLNNPDRLKARRDYILDLMAAQGYATKEAAARAQSEDLALRPIAGNTIAPHFAMWVKELLTEKYGEKEVETGGFKVITTLDLEKQKIAEEEIKTGVEKVEKKYGSGNGALVAIDVKTGGVRAMVGSRDFFDETRDGQVNVALRPRQPGSSFKPVVYTAAFEKGYTADTVLYDAVTKFATEIGKDYEPHNYDGKEHGPLTVRKALAGSLNVPAVKMIYLTGVSRVLDLAEKMGYTTFGDRSRFGLSLTLGGGEVKLLEHVGAMSILARDGKRIPISPILKIERGGAVLEEWQEPDPEQVVSPEAVRTTVSIMTDNDARAFTFGAKNSLTLPGRIVAAKTGTTNDWRDAWTVGFTPSLAAGVWVGNNDNAPLKRGADGVLVAAPIWNTFMRRALEGTPAESFPPAPENTADKPILRGEVGGVKVKVNRLNGKIATESTPPEFVEERVYRQTHSILHWLDKDDPRGPPPADPAQDPQYTRWEEAVTRWATAQGIRDEEPPTEFDAPLDPAVAPQVNIFDPPDGATWTSRAVTVRAHATAPRGVGRVAFMLDDAPLGTVQGGAVTEGDFTLSTYLRTAEKGFHTLTVRAFDAQGAVGGAQAVVNLMVEIDAPTIFWDAPESGAALLAAHFPVTLRFSLHRANEIKKISFFARILGGDDLIEIKTFSSINPLLSVLSWPTAPPAGEYDVSALVTDASGATRESRSLQIKIE